MNATRKHSLRAGVAVTALLLLLTASSPAAAAGDHDHDRGRHQRYSRRAWAPPLPPAPPLPRMLSRALPRARVFAAPRTIRVIPYHTSAYSPYFAGRVFYAPYQCYLDVYYFPVAIGPQIVYQPYYYLNGQLFYGLEGGSPRFFFSLTF